MFEYRYYVAELTHDNIHEMIVWAKRNYGINFHDRYEDIIKYINNDEKIYIFLTGRVFKYAAEPIDLSLMTHEYLVKGWVFTPTQEHELQNKEFKQIEKRKP